jgi:hypothetical protein
VAAKHALSIIAAAGSVAACASMPPPHQQIGAARAMVAQAQPVAARDAPAELGTAQAKLARAEAAMKREDYVNARIYAEQAEVDAKYAWTLALRRELERRPR